jgi:Ca2+-binding RTX toxin-like protein
VGVTVDLTRPDVPQGQTGENDIIKNVEDMMGGDGDDTLRGDADNNDITGNQGNDHLDGGDGKDRLPAAPGATP